MPIKTVSIIIDRQEKTVTPGLVKGQELINLSGVVPPEQLFLEVLGDIDVPISPADGILIRGGEKFSIGDGLPTVEDNPCLRHPIRFRFNDDPLPTEKLFQYAKVTGAELKQLDPNLQPGDMLVADLEGLADESIDDEQRIVLQHKDKFITVPCGNVGFNDPLELQIQAVQAIFPKASLIENAGNRFLVVEQFPVPDHFVPAEVTLLVILPNGFPMAAPDMFWVTPNLRLTDSREPEGAGVVEQYLGKAWQRFSWHYANGSAAWRVGQSSLMSHIQFCQARLALVK